MNQAERPSDNTHTYTHTPAHTHTPPPLQVMQGACPATCRPVSINLLVIPPATTPFRPEHIAAEISMAFGILRISFVTKESTTSNNAGVDSPPCFGEHVKLSLLH
ncbi:jg3649 [Pararge aegeria aegeria]|uniref:Jg3649 protein n=1 Tax=Pararge aegeria aegeria TaxID=348720 RepID=A0A8S4RJQ6_9NEOP|nr:jg3649 [Pararge aegeria aegeria]